MGNLHIDLPSRTPVKDVMEQGFAIMATRAELRLIHV